MGVRVPPFAPGRFFPGPRDRPGKEFQQGKRSMQQAVQNTPGPLERNLTVSVPVEQIEAEIATRLKKLARTARMEGFRPGKGPFKLVQRHYGFQVRQEAASEPVTKSFNDAARSRTYRVAG